MSNFAKLGSAARVLAQAGGPAPPARSVPRARPGRTDHWAPRLLETRPSRGFLSKRSFCMKAQYPKSPRSISGLVAVLISVVGIEAFRAMIFRQ